MSLFSNIKKLLNVDKGSDHKAPDGQEAFQTFPMKSNAYLFGRKYEVIEHRDTGISHDYVCYDSQEAKPCFITTVRPDLMYEHPFVERFEEAYKLLIDLPEHKHIQQVYTIKKQDGRPYVILEHAKGATLEQLLKDKPLNIADAVSIAIQVCDGMQSIYNARRIIHRDLKPRNIIIDQYSDVKLTGFYLAKREEDDDIFEKGTILGTLGYMAPESYDEGIYDCISDIYSLGVCMYEMFCGRPPYDQTSIHVPASYLAKHVDEATAHDPQQFLQLRKDWPEGFSPFQQERNEVLEGLSYILRKATALKREERYRNYEVLKVDLGYIRHLIMGHAVLKFGVPSRSDKLCEIHPSFKATEFCPVCKKGYCTECMVEKDGQKICRTCAA